MVRIFLIKICRNLNLGLNKKLFVSGTVRGGTQLQTFKSVGKHTYATLSSVTLLQHSVVHITVIAINYAGIRTVSYSDPILVDLTGPVISNIIDGEKGEIYSTTIACITMQRFSKTCLK